MFLDVKELHFAPFGQKQHMSIELFSEQIEEDVLAKRIKGELELTKLENEILAKFKGEAKVKTVCDRCLSDFEFDIPLLFSQEYTLGIPEDEEKLRIEKDFRIDITEPIRQFIITSLPAKKLCKKDCPGICPKCGKNRNIDICKCKKAEKKL